MKKQIRKFGIDQKLEATNHHRRSIRLKGYDYSRAGVYFVSIVTRGRLVLFGKIENGEMNMKRPYPKSPFHLIDFLPLPI